MLLLSPMNVVLVVVFGDEDDSREDDAGGGGIRRSVVMVGSRRSSSGRSISIEVVVGGRATADIGSEEESGEKDQES